MNKPFDASVYIGRFQPFLNTHLAQLRQALALAPRCLLVIAGACQAASPRSPFGAEQRAAMIRHALSPDELQRVDVIAMRDDYDTGRWSSQLRQRLEKTAPQAQRIALVREPDSHLPALPWADEQTSAPGLQPAQAWREQMYAAADPQAELERQRDLLAPGTQTMLAAWLGSPAFQSAAESWHTLRQLRAEWDGSPYTPIFVTVDSVLLCAGQVLLIQRGRAPGKGLYALPGGFIEAEETVTTSALRELKEETCLNVPLSELHAALREVRLFDAPWRSQRGRVLTHAHFFDLGQRALPAICAGDDAADAFWVPLAELTSLEERFHDDHFQILDAFLHLVQRDDAICSPAQ